jgi:hypothetical protein
MLVQMAMLWKWAAATKPWGVSVLEDAGVSSIEMVVRTLKDDPPPQRAWISLEDTGWANWNNFGKPRLDIDTANSECKSYETHEQNRPGESVFMLARHTVACPEGHALQSFKYIAPEEGGRMQIRYTCCVAAFVADSCQMLQSPKQRVKETWTNYMRWANISRGHGAHYKNLADLEVDCSRANKPNSVLSWFRLIDPYTYAGRKVSLAYAVTRQHMAQQFIQYQFGCCQVHTFDGVPMRSVQQTIAHEMLDKFYRTPARSFNYLLSSYLTEVQRFFALGEGIHPVRWGFVGDLRLQHLECPEQQRMMESFKAVVQGNSFSHSLGCIRHKGGE